LIQMIELEKFDKENDKSIILPFYLVKDGAMINSLVFRSPADCQYAVINSDTFEKCEDKIITCEDIEYKRLTAQFDSFPHALDWHSQYVDGLWLVSQIQSFENWYHNSKFVGYLFPSNEVLPKTYKQFQGKRNELKIKQEKFERWVNSIKPINTESIPF